MFQDKNPILHYLFFRDWMPGRELDAFVAKVMTTAIWGEEQRVGAHTHAQHTRAHTNIISTFTCVCITSCVWVTSCLQPQWQRCGLHTRHRGPLQNEIPAHRARMWHLEALSSLETWAEPSFGGWWVWGGGLFRLVPWTRRVWVLASYHHDHHRRFDAYNS